MPCRDFYDSNPEMYYEKTVHGLKKQVSFAESALCQTLEALVRSNEKPDSVADPLDLIDFKEAGITKEQLKKWWIHHKYLDEKNRAKAEAAAKKEQKKRELETRKKEILSKLTKEEKEVLGLKD